MTGEAKCCAECGAPLEKRNRGGLCRRHTAARVMSDPETCAKVSQSRRRMFMADPVQREAQARRIRAARSTPQAVEARRATVLRLRLWEAGNAAQPAGSESRMRAGRNTRAARIPWCPPELREQYYFLTRKKRLKAAEAKALVLAQHEAEMQRFRRSLGNA